MDRVKTGRLDRKGLSLSMFGYIWIYFSSLRSRGLWHLAKGCLYAIIGV